MAKTRAITRSLKSGRRKPQFSVVAQQNVFDSNDILSLVLYYCSLKEMGNFVVAFPKKKEVLTDIEIDYDVTINCSKLIKFLFSNKIRLTSFTLDYDHKLTDYHLLALAYLSPNLRTIGGAYEYQYQWSVSAAGIRWLIERCPKIEEWFLLLRKPEVFLEIVSNAYPDLRGVQIGPFDEGNGEQLEIDRSIVVSFVNRCQQLEHLKIVQSDIEDADFERICTLHRLKYLEIMDCDYLTPNSLHFLQRCNHLETLVIINSWLHSFDDEDEKTVFNDTIFALLSELKSLRYVKLDIRQYEEGDFVELIGDIVVPPAWRRVISNDGDHEFFKL